MEIEISELEYHAHDALSNSKAKVYRQSSKLYKAMYVDKTMQQKTTDAMLLGTLVHCLTLEPYRYAERYAVAPKVDRRTTQGKADWKKFCELSEGKQVVESDMHWQATSIVKELLSNRAALTLINQDGPVEQSYFWKHPIAGIECRGKFDKIITASDLIIDIKTAQDATPGSFGNVIVDRGYDFQAAWYCEGYKIVHGEWPTFVFVVVESEPPYEVGLYELHESDLADAKEDNDVVACEIAERMQSGDWSQAHERDVVKLTLPNSKKYRNQYAY